MFWKKGVKPCFLRRRETWATSAMLRARAVRLDCRAGAALPLAHDAESADHLHRSFGRRRVPPPRPRAPTVDRARRGRLAAALRWAATARHRRRGGAVAAASGNPYSRPTCSRTRSTATCKGAPDQAGEKRAAALEGGVPALERLSAESVVRHEGDAHRQWRSARSHRTQRWRGQAIGGWRRIGRRPHMRRAITGSETRDVPSTHVNRRASGHVRPSARCGRERLAGEDGDGHPRARQIRERSAAPASTSATSSSSSSRAACQARQRRQARTPAVPSDAAGRKGAYPYSTAHVKPPKASRCAE